MTLDQADLLLRKIKDHAACSDLRMYAWARRRGLQEKHASAGANRYALKVEKTMANFAEEAYEEAKELIMDLASGKLPKLEAEAEKEKSDLHQKLNHQTARH